MSRDEVFTAGNLRMRYDNTTRIVTTYDALGVITATRHYTPTENAAADATEAAYAREQVQTQLATDTATDLVKLTAVITDLQTLLGDGTVIGSIRNARASISNTYNRDAVRALADLLISEAQSTRRIARQTLRLAKAMAGDFGSADVGPE